MLSGKVIAALITSVVGPAIIFLLRWYFQGSEDETEAELILKNRKNEINDNIKNRLDSILEELSADRVWVMEFSEEERTASMVYESLANGISSEKEYYDDIKIRHIKDLIEDLIQNDELVYDRIEEVKNHQIISMFKEEGNVSMYFFAIKTLDKIVIGILGVDYVYNQHDLTEEEKTYLKTEASKLAGYLETRDITINPKNEE